MTSFTWDSRLALVILLIDFLRRALDPPLSLFSSHVVLFYDRHTPIISKQKALIHYRVPLALQSFAVPLDEKSFQLLASRWPLNSSILDIQHQ